MSHVYSGKLKKLPVPITDLFCICLEPALTSSGPDPGRPETSLENLNRLLPCLSLSSSCFLIGEGSPEESIPFKPFLQRICRFVEENLICQVNLRPLHPVRPGSIDSWIEAYRHLLPVCRPFQREGYRNQILSRLRIFPVLHVEEVSLVREVAPLLVFLRENFFLPSVFIPKKLAVEMTRMLRGQGAVAVERFYLGEGGSFEPEKVLEDLYRTTFLERMIDHPPQEAFKLLEPICAGSLILEASGATRGCVYGRTIAVEPFTAAGTPSGSPQSNAACRECFPDESDPRSCVACTLEALERTGMEWRLNMRADEWGLVCNRLADALFRTGRFDEALRAWEASFQEKGVPEPPLDLLLRRAVCFHAKGDLERAMEELRKAREKDPGSPEIVYYIGLCEFGWKDYIEAADRFLEALQLGLRDPLRQEAEVQRGLCHYHLEEFDEALEALEAAERAGRRDSPVCFYLGLSRLGKGETERGLSCLLDALALGPSADDLFHVLFYIAHAYKELGVFDHALDYLNRADSMQPGSQEVLNLMGFCRFKQKRYEEAIGCFRKAIEIDPGSAIDYANIGSCLRDKGDPEGAKAMYRKALSLDTTIDFARENLERLSERQAGGGHGDSDCGGENG